MKTEKKKNVVKNESNIEEPKKSKFALYWESEREPWFEIVDMKAVLR
jgi:hypothetical protein